MSTETPTFATLGLAAPLLRAIEKAGYTTPTPIQLQAIPLVLAGHDLLAAAQTGTGKTAGFTLPILHHLLADGAPRASARKPLCLILTPTRELAAQVNESVRTYGNATRIRSTVIFGGVNINPQIKAMQAGVEILVATPGRLLDHVMQKTVDLSDVQILVLDEADRMLDMGFIHDIKRVLRLLPAKRQNLLFSATFSDEIRGLAAGLLNSPREVSVARRNTSAELVEQQAYIVPQAAKRELLSWLIGSQQWSQVLVFTRTKHGANRLAEQLEKDGIRAMAIHGNKSQGARTRALDEFKSRRLRVLVATDIAARGLDIDQLPHVVNFELPNVSEDYVHRIGRTGRAGASGHAISLVDIGEISLLRDIEKLINRSVMRMEQEGFTVPEPTGRIVPFKLPPRQPRPPSSRGQRPGGSASKGGAGKSGHGQAAAGQSGSGWSASGSAGKTGGAKPAGGKPGAGNGAGRSGHRGTSSGSFGRPGRSSGSGAGRRPGGA